MNNSIVKAYFIFLAICGFLFLALPSLSSAEEGQAMTATPPQSSQQDNMGNKMDMNDKGMMDHMDKMGDMKNHHKATKPQSNPNTAPQSKPDTSKSMQGDM